MRRPRTAAGRFATTTAEYTEPPLPRFFAEAVAASAGSRWSSQTGHSHAASTSSTRECRPEEDEKDEEEEDEEEEDEDEEEEEEAKSSRDRCMRHCST